jgi:hypothetical protein
MVNAAKVHENATHTSPSYNEQSDFDRYLDEGVPLSRPLTTSEALYVYRELK